MGWRFQKRIRIAPGVRANLSKRGVGFSFGGRGVRYSVGPTGRRTTFSIPGTGLSYVRQRGRRSAEAGGCTCCLGVLTLGLAAPLLAILVVVLRRVRAKQV